LTVPGLEDLPPNRLAGQRVSVSGQYNEVQTNFNPEIGFTRRRDNTQYQSDVGWRPLLRNSDTIRKSELHFGR
jgi:hypothetical protein